jgi:hypothetical protein
MWLNCISQLQPSSGVANEKTNMEEKVCRLFDALAVPAEKGNCGEGMEVV